ncbi:MAG: AMP-binding protein [Oligoflexia bacterium]|nr:AMP-binding protein [Oligoflexia bacterium]
MVEFDWLKKWSKYSPNKIALKEIGSNKKASYKEFYNSSMALAEKLKTDYKIGFGDRVAVLSLNEFEYVLLFYATQRLGAVLVPINFRLTSREVEHILKDSSPKLVVYQNEFLNVLDGAKYECARWFMSGSSKSIESFCAEFKEAKQNLDFDESINGETVCMILYTSGTTGAPKGAMIHNDMLFWNSINTSLRLNLSQNDKTLIFMPFFHTGGWNVLTTPFFHKGAEILLLKKFDAVEVLEICEKEKLTILFAVPTMMEMMAQCESFKDADLKSIRYAVVGGEASSLKLIQTWNLKGIPFRQGYGLTEFGPNVFSLNEEDAERKTGSIGFANFYIQTKVVDIKGNEVGTNEVGELLLKGPMCMKGYWNNLKATVETIRDGWLYTGDLVKKDDQGYFYVVGRKKEMFISGGENVYPIEIEQVIRSHPLVKEGAVIGVKDSKWGEVGKAFIVLKANALQSDVVEGELKAFCKKNLAGFKVPKYFEFINDLPKSQSGKILKRNLA